MASAVALVSLLTTGAVAISVPLIAARLQRSQRADDKRAERLDELRSVVDGSSVALARAEIAMQGLETSVEAHARRAATTRDGERADAAIAAGERTIADVAESWHRMSARLGWQAGTCKLYGLSLADLKSELQYLCDVRDGGPASDDPDEWAAVLENLHAIRSRYERHREAFYDAVTQLVGT